MPASAAARALRQMEKRYARILFLCDFPLLGALEEVFREGSIENVLADAEAGGAGVPWKISGALKAAGEATRLRILALLGEALTEQRGPEQPIERQTGGRQCALELVRQRDPGGCERLQVVRLVAHAGLLHERQLADPRRAGVDRHHLAGQLAGLGRAEQQRPDRMIGARRIEANPGYSGGTFGDAVGIRERQAKLLLHTSLQIKIERCACNTDDAQHTAVELFQTRNCLVLQQPLIGRGHAVEDVQCNAEERRGFWAGVLGDIDRDENGRRHGHQRRHADDERAADQGIRNSTLLAEERRGLREERRVELAEPLEQHGPED